MATAESTHGGATGKPSRQERQRGEKTRKERRLLLQRAAVILPSRPEYPAEQKCLCHTSSLSNEIRGDMSAEHRLPRGLRHTRVTHERPVEPPPDRGHLRLQSGEKKPHCLNFIIFH